ncbi:MAG: hypothetical protein M3P95_10785 [Actinomycetota bacterium]|nr:hypothetical protein [Actinomycetota bacterium]
MPRQAQVTPTHGKDVTTGTVIWTVSAAAPRTLGRGLAVLLVLLTLGHATALFLRHGLGMTYAFGLVEFLDLDFEEGFGTWANTSLHLLCALLSALAALVAGAQGDSWSRNWWTIAAVFVFLSLDEVGTLHEDLITPIRDAFDLGGVLYLSWIVPAVGLGLLFLVSQVRFLRHHWHTIGRDLVVAGVLFVAGAVGVEMAEAVVAERGLKTTLANDLLTGLQEFVEIGAVMMAAVALLRHLVTTLGMPTIRAVPQSSSGSS